MAEGCNTCGGAKLQTIPHYTVVSPAVTGKEMTALEIVQGLRVTVTREKNDVQGKDTNNT